MNKKKVPLFVLIILGFLCLTPVLGALMGLISIVMGLTFYRNKILVIMGITGIVITIIACSYLNYYSTHRGPFDKARIEGAQQKLRNLISEIELYKINKGNYPHNLTDLLNDVTYKLDFYDPVQAVHPDSPDKNFFYKIEGEKYYLFSKGFDGIPFTTDDLLPSMTGLDPKRLGIITP